MFTQSSQHYEHDTKIAYDPEGYPVLRDSFVLQLLEALQFTMNFTFKLKVAHTWGEFNDVTNKWEGMVADILAGEADLGISSSADLAFRRAVVDFNMPTNRLKLSAFFKKPQAATHANALIEPFKGIFWFVLICSMISLSLVLIIFKWVLVRTISYPQVYSSDIYNDGVFMKLDTRRLDTLGSRHNFTDIDSFNEPRSLWSPSDCFQWALAVFCNQEFYNIPKYDCCRIVIGMGSLAAVIVYGAYAGTLISFLSVVVDSITNVEQLVSKSYVLSIVGSNITLRFMRDELLHGSFVFIDYRYSGYNSLNNKFSARDSCSIQELVIDSAAEKQGTMVPKNSPYKRKIDFQILRMTERGVINQILKRFIPTRIHHCSGVVFDGVQLTSVSVAFVILAAGTLLSVFIIMAENGRGRSARVYRP
ncbi:unnamed protein product [Allacma fusca]|uniref:Ionotropic glutamate receptor L-glutamate and glycine-binding domain-containing protein n=1 Tax=Allacma fusca TaxID=39272 RepID=A0A8J2P7W9_9HEXA|nr:unnamed protein product [Allacma fusca]